MYIANSPLLFLDECDHNLCSSTNTITNHDHALFDTILRQDLINKTALVELLHDPVVDQILRLDALDFRIAALHKTNDVGYAGRISVGLSIQAVDHVVVA